MTEQEQIQTAKDALRKMMTGDRQSWVRALIDIPSTVEQMRECCKAFKLYCIYHGGEDDLARLRTAFVAVGIESEFEYFE